jgi:hypothetical protein
MSLRHATRPFWIVLFALITACGTVTQTDPEAAESTPSPSATAEPTPTATPTDTPTPTPEPTPDPAAFGAEYVAIVDAWVAAQCPSQAIIDAAPEDLAAWNEAMTIAAPAIVTAATATALRATNPPAAVEDEIGQLLEAMDERAAAAEQIAVATSMDEVYFILDTTFATTAETIGQTGDAIRTELGLGPRDPAPCG